MNRTFIMCECTNVYEENHVLVNFSQVMFVKEQHVLCAHQLFIRESTLYQFLPIQRICPVFVMFAKPASKNTCKIVYFDKKSPSKSITIERMELDD